MIKKLKQFMSEQAISHGDMAKRIGTSKFTFSRWMNGKNKVSPAYQSIINYLIK